MSAREVPGKMEFQSPLLRSFKMKFLSPILCIVSWAPATMSFAQVQANDFDTWVGFDTGRYLEANFPYGMAVGDLDQDGAPDVVATNWFAFSKLSVLFNNGEGRSKSPSSSITLQAPTMSPSPI